MSFTCTGATEKHFDPRVDLWKRASRYEAPKEDSAEDGVRSLCKRGNVFEKKELEQLDKECERVHV